MRPHPRDGIGGLYAGPDGHQGEATPGASDPTPAGDLDPFGRRPLERFGQGCPPPRSCRRGCEGHASAPSETTRRTNLDRSRRGTRRDPVAAPAVVGAARDPASSDRRDTSRFPDLDPNSPCRAGSQAGSGAPRDRRGRCGRHRSGQHRPMGGSELDIGEVVGPPPEQSLQTSVPPRPRRRPPDHRPSVGDRHRGHPARHRHRPHPGPRRGGADDRRRRRARRHLRRRRAALLPPARPAGARRVRPS